MGQRSGGGCAGGGTPAAPAPAPAGGGRVHHHHRPLHPLHHSSSRQQQQQPTLSFVPPSSTTTPSSSSISSTVSAGANPSALVAAAAQLAAMKRRRAVRIVLCQQTPVRAAERFALDIQVRLPCDCRLLDINATLEGRCRAAFDGHDNLQTIVNIPLDFRPLSNYVQAPQSKDKDATVSSADSSTPPPPPPSKHSLVLPAGIHRVVSAVTLPANVPGTFKGRHGAIGYRAVVKIRVACLPRGDEMILEGDKTIDVIGAVPLDSFSGHDKPVLIDQHFTRSLFLCFSRLDVKVAAELERAAYRSSEHVLVSGTVENGASSSSIKSVNIELRQMTQYLNGTGKKLDNRLISSLSCGSCDVNAALTLHHSLQIPANAYPSLVNPNSAVQVFYELHITGCGDRFRVEIPLFVGNRLTAPSPAAAEPSKKKKTSTAARAGPGRPRSVSDCCATTDTTNSAASDDSPLDDFVRVHQHHPFMPVYGIRQMPPFGMPPPFFPHHHHPPPRYEPPHNYKPFLKIEEITGDDE